MCSSDLNPGDCLCITGEHRASKSLLLQLILAEKEPTSGKVTVDAVDLSSLPPHLLRLYRRNIGVMFGEEQLVSDRSIASNIALALEARGDSPDAMAARVTELLERIGLIEKLTFLPELLTQEEKHLVMFAQAVAHEPRILLLLDPFEHLDPENKTIVLALLQNAQKNGATIVMTSSEPIFFSSLSQKTAYLKNGSFAEASKKKTTSSIPSPSSA